VEQSERHLFGLAPPALLLALGAVAVVAGVVVLVLGDWLLGVILLVVGVPLLLLAIGAARQFPQGRAATTTLHASDVVHDWLGFAGTSVGSWSRASRATVRLRTQAGMLRREQRLLFERLGEAVFREDDGRAADLLEEAHVVQARIDRAEETLQRERASARRSVASERRAIQATEIKQPEK
jgi:hypothetical protein